VVGGGSYRRPDQTSLTLCGRDTPVRGKEKDEALLEAALAKMGDEEEAEAGEEAGEELEDTDEPPEDIKLIENSEGPIDLPEDPEEASALLKVMNMLNPSPPPDPQDLIPHLREHKSAAVLKYVQATDINQKIAAAYLLLPEDAQALDDALRDASSDSEKEKIIKQFLKWDQAIQAAAELTRRHPEFTELKEVLAHFPPLVFHIGEPSVAHYKLKVL